MSKKTRFEKEKVFSQAALQTAREYEAKGIKVSDPYFNKCYGIRHETVETIELAVVIESVYSVDYINEYSFRDGMSGEIPKDTVTKYGVFQEIEFPIKKTLGAGDTINITLKHKKRHYDGQYVSILEAKDSAGVMVDTGVLIEDDYQIVYNKRNRRITKEQYASLAAQK